MTFASNISLVDYAVSQTGSAFSLFEYSLKNKLPIDTLLTAGQLVDDILYNEVEFDSFKETITLYDLKIKKYNIIKGQSIFDIAIQELGSVFSAFDIAIENKIAIGDILKIGQKLEVSKTAIDNDVVKYFQGKQILISTYETGYEIVEKINYELPGDFPYSF